MKVQVNGKVGDEDYELIYINPPDESHTAETLYKCYLKMQMHSYQWAQDQITKYGHVPFDRRTLKSSISENLQEVEVFYDNEEDTIFDT